MQFLRNEPRFARHPDFPEVMVPLNPGQHEEDRAIVKALEEGVKRHLQIYQNKGRYMCLQSTKCAATI